MSENNHKDFLKNPRLKALGIYFSTLGPIGYIPYFPGTWGALTATILAPFVFLPLSLFSRILILLLIFFAGAITSNLSEQHFKKKDPSAVIIDELGGQFLTFIALIQVNIFLLLAGFIIFRIFDIVKPWPVNKSEQWLPKGFGIMLDDYVAGICGAIVLAFINYLI